MTLFIYTKYENFCRTVALSVFNFMIAYIFLLFAFASAFMIVFPDNEAFALLPSAIIKVPVVFLKLLLRLSLSTRRIEQGFLEPGLWI
jgi:hypothetical protein